MIDRASLKQAQAQFESGDVVALVSNKYPGMVVVHTGFIDRLDGGPPCLLHASSYHRRVVLTRGDVASYVQLRPDRQGLMVARPRSP